MHLHWEPVRYGWRRMGELLWSCVQESWTCRECRGPVKPLDNVCAQCGAFHPAKIPISASVATTFVISIAMIVLLRLA